jgi:hypothetical protein
MSKIVVYPMLVSRAVSENSIPGIAKTVENFILVKLQEELINNINATEKSRGGVFSSLGKLMMNEDEDLSEAGGIPPGAGGPTGGKAERVKQQNIDQKTLKKRLEDSEKKIDDINNKLEKSNTSHADKQALEKEKQEYKKKRDIEDDKLKAIERMQKDKDRAQDQIEKDARKASAKVAVSDMKSITLEPTYMTIETSDKFGNKSNRFVGVKVVPIRVKADVKLSHLLLYDTKVSALFAVSLKMGRNIMRRFWSFFDKWTSRFRIGGLTPSGDPRRDIIMRRTGMGKESATFIVLSKQEDVDEFFLDNIQKINRLFRMGWGNFIIADDIARTAWFCMDQFNGMCSAVPYSMMYKHLGQEKAFETMEDARKANSSIFKISKSFSRIVGECKAELKLDKYSMLSEDNHDE